MGCFLMVEMITNGIRIARDADFAENLKKWGFTSVYLQWDSLREADIELLRGKQRDREIVWPRQVAMYLMREETSASLLQIGTELGGRDHTTIIHGWEKVHSEMGNNDRVRQEIAAVLDSLQHWHEAL